MRRLVKCDAASLFVFHKILFFCAADVPGKNTGKLLIFIAQHKGQCILIITFISLIRKNAAQPRLTIGEYVTTSPFSKFLFHTFAPVPKVPDRLRHLIHILKTQYDRSHTLPARSPLTLKYGLRLCVKQSSNLFFHTLCFQERKHPVCSNFTHIRTAAVKRNLSPLSCEDTYRPPAPHPTHLAQIPSPGYAILQAA